MEKRAGWLLGLLILMLILSGCTTLTDARNAKDTGTFRIFDAPFDSVWAVIPLAATEAGLTVVIENRSEGYILAQRGATFFSLGENVAIFVERADSEARTRVEVVSKRAMATNIFARDWRAEVLDRIQQKLKNS